MKINHIVSAGTYPFDVMFSFGETEDEIIERLRERGIEIKKEDLLMETPWRGLNHRLKDGEQIIRMKKVPYTVDDFSTLVHEIFHASYFILNRVGIKLKPSTEEAYTYLIQHFYREIVNEISNEQLNTWDGNVYEG